MTNMDTLQNAENGRWYARIDRETLTGLTILLDRVADTLGTIAPVLELSKDKSVTEKKRHFRAVTDLAFRGHIALKTFLQQWALVLEENEKRLFRAPMEDFADIIDKAKQIEIPDQPSSSGLGKTEETHPLHEAAGIDPSSNSGSVIAETIQNCQAIQQI